MPDYRVREAVPVIKVIGSSDANWNRFCEYNE